MGSPFSDQPHCTCDIRKPALPVSLTLSQWVISWHVTSDIMNTCLMDSPDWDVSVGVTFSAGMSSYAGAEVVQLKHVFVWCGVTSRNGLQACDCIHAPLAVFLMSGACWRDAAWFSAPQMISCCFGCSKRFTWPPLCSSHPTCCGGRRWQLFIRVICSHLAHDGQGWSSDLLPLPPSHLLSDRMEITSRQAPGLMYSLLMWKA